VPFGGRCDLEASFSAQVEAAAWWTRAIDEVPGRPNWPSATGQGNW